jgi:hypothetical protein
MKEVFLILLTYFVMTDIYVCVCVCKKLNFSIVSITVHIVHFIMNSSKMCRICYKTVTKECNNIDTAICGQLLELSEIFTVKN